MTEAAFANCGEKLLYKVEEVAQMLAIGRSKMWEIVLRGDIDSVKLDGSRRITREAVHAYVRRLAESGSAGA